MQRINEPNKRDDGKTNFTLLSPEFNEEIANVFTQGLQKYNAWNYVMLDSDRVKASLMRHVNDYMKGIDKDAESGLPQLAHIAANAQMLYVIESRQSNTRAWNRYAQLYSKYNETRDNNYTITT